MLVKPIKSDDLKQKGEWSAGGKINVGVIDSSVLLSYLKLDIGEYIVMTVQLN